MLISLIIPCYNEEAAIPLFYEELQKTTSKLSDYDFEFLFVDDGSTDSTLDLLKDMAALDSRIVFLSFSRNFGKEAAIYAGLSNAKGDYVAVMDADMQDPPELLCDMIDILSKQNYDSVAAYRNSRRGEPKLRSLFANAFYKIMNKMSDSNIVSGARDFRLMKRSMVDAIIKMNEYNRFSKGIFGWVGFKTYWLPYENVERVAGDTKWSFWKLLKYSMEGIINFSQAPLQFASICGCFFTLLSFLMILFVIVRHILFGDPVAGWASTVCIVMFMGGIQLLGMGIMGQYIAKTYLETKHRPVYIISETNGDEIIKIK